jgi:hypothetical protein
VKRGLLALLLWVSPVGCVWAEDPVYFADPKLKGAVQAELWISDPTPTDMLGLTDLYAGGLGITDITGIEYATNLVNLSLRWNRLTDISPLSGLTGLEHLDFHANFSLSDISPLSALTRLKTLVLRSNTVTDISSLSGLSDLEELDLSDDEISDVSPLSGLTHLRTLNLSDNKVSDVSPLADLTCLEELDLRANPLGPDACGTYLLQIRQNNPGIYLRHDACGSRHILISSTAGGSVTYPGEGEFTYDNGELIKVQAQADPCFVFVGWTGSYPSQGNPVFITMREDHEIRANFVSVLDTMHVDDESPNDPGENGKAEHPFHRIQEAIEVARSGVTIVVHAGTYHEMIDLLGKSLTLTGFDPNDRGAGAWPVLDGNGVGPVASFTHGEDPNCTLSGFVITGGKGRFVGAILCSASSPKILNCLITGNRATDAAGGVVYCMDSNAVFVNCTIADNDAGQNGAGLYVVNGYMKVVNSILWGNGPREIVSMGLGGPCVSYSDVEGGWEGPGCIDADPLFVGAGDYHLQSQLGRWDPRAQKWIQDQATSPCVGAGDPGSLAGQEPSFNGNIINMGAYGGTAQASKSPF